MILRTSALVTILFFAGSILGCNTDPETDHSDAPSPPTENSDMPPNWKVFNVNKFHSKGELKKITVDGTKHSLKEIVEKLSDNFAKPIKFHADIDTEQFLDAFKFQSADGSWESLLSSVAEKFNGVVEESQSEFLIKPVN